MAAMTAPTAPPARPEQRKNSRVDYQAHVEVDLPDPGLHPLPNNRRPSVLRLEGNSLNLSEGGIRLRLRGALEIRSRIRVRVFETPSRKPLECAGQVAWVVQRMDLDDQPPFLYDVGVQFIDPPPRLRQFALRAGVTLKPVVTKPIPIQPATISGRLYLPHLDHEPAGSWHLVVWVEGVPCFSHRYPSQREALEGWTEFRKKTAGSLRQPRKPRRK